MLSRFTDVDRKVEAVLHRLEGLTGRNRGIVPRSGDPLLKRIRDVIWSYFFSSTWTISATVKTEDAQQGQPPPKLLDGCTDNQMKCTKFSAATEESSMFRCLQESYSRQRTGKEDEIIYCPT
ncbi:hypothetical protein OPV22_001495 [Ensete ventricosum]|uniref:Uncharacterized protein n=1 Tax=Ensete ventricosum TaxID=4639 RepID=A0AAV8RSD7_ENSVE|nr:hypothetical protein OPV22_001495 [Ensete ventricosum]